LRKILRPFLGFFLVILGVIGLILPIMPGWVFLIPGLIILADYFPPIRRLVDWAKAKASAHPKW
jgi:uncharacterized membrane protein YbaN (DUF454 family)